MEMTPPFENAKYIEAIKSAEKAGYDVLIVDSITHQWAGEGGLLNKKEQMDARGGNSFANWAKMTPEHEKFKATIQHSKIHLIATVRSKQDYVLGENDKGRQAPKKVGLAPVQREGMEYEFTTVFDVAMNHEAATSKDRTGLFVDKIFQITEETGMAIKKWVEGGKEVVEEPAKQSPFKPNPPPDVIEDYVLKVGQNAGKKLREVPLETLKGFYDWCLNEEKKRTLQINTQEAKQNIEIFLDRIAGEVELKVI
jgi:hypothetical protein